MKHFFYPILFFGFLFGLNPAIKAQTIDDFKDDNFSLDPTWQGDDSLFVVNTLQQLQTAARLGSSGEIALNTRFEPIANTEWRIWVRLAFNPSSQNNARIYLCANQPNLKTALNGFYVQLGGSTGNTDSISLYKQSGLTRTCIIRGRAGTLGKSNNQMQLKVTRSLQGEWNLYSDTSAQSNFVFEGSSIDTAYANANYFGMVCKYTSTNVANFLFDDIYIGQPIIDNKAPVLTAVLLDQPNTLRFSFDEKVVANSNFKVSLEDSIQPASALFENNEIKLIFIKPIPQDQLISCKIIGVQDQNANALDTTFTLQLHWIKPGDILITEIMADPEPSNGLPLAEYVEIYNNTNYTLNINNQKLSDASSSVILPTFTMEAGKFVILCNQTDSANFKGFGRTIALPYFPTLNNGGDVLSIIDQNNVSIDVVNYNLDYYKNTQKEAGGWSLELINPKQICKAQNNWMASNTSIGGTPGTINSNWQTTKDTLAPQLLFIEPINAFSVKLQFSEAAQLIGNYQNMVQLNGIKINEIIIDPSKQNEMIVVLQDSLVHQQNYSLQIDSIADCLGNTSIQTKLFTYIAIAAPKQHDILINEIYFDLTRKGNFPNHEFIELYNRSEFALSLSQLELSDGSSNIRLPNYTLLPKHLLILCHKDNAGLFEPNGEVLGLPSFPSLSNSDVLTLKDSIGYMLHQVKYTQDWFSNTAKVYSCSMEMIDTRNPCGKQENWQASASFDGATPGQENSIKDIKKDNSKPNMKRIYIPDLNTLLINFNEDIDSISLATSNNVKLNQSIPSNYYRYANGHLNQIEFSFETALDSLQTYEINIGELSDCALNKSEDISSANFQVPKKAMRGDLQWNEILFNPKPGSNDFVELYNTTNHTIDLKGLYFTSTNENGLRVEPIPIAQEAGMAFPGEYLAFSIDAALLQKWYSVQNPNAALEMSLPSLNDDEGNILLINEKDEVLDSLYYSEKMHLSFLNNKEGISLERINPFIFGSDQNNWTSAAEEQQFGTPTSRNSQYKIGKQNGNFSLSQAYFSPDSDGENDVMVFSYTNKTDKNIGSLHIYNDAGQIIKRICDSKVLGSSGELHWAGDSDKGEKANIGMYLAVWQTYSANGEGEKSVRSFALLGK